MILEEVVCAKGFRIERRAKIRVEWQSLRDYTLPPLLNIHIASTYGMVFDRTKSNHNQTAHKYSILLCQQMSQLGIYIYEISLFV